LWEYILRQTGVDVSHEQVRARLNNVLKPRAEKDTTRTLTPSQCSSPSKLTNRTKVHRLIYWKTSKDHLLTHDWMAELGEDLFLMSNLSSSSVEAKKAAKLSISISSTGGTKQKRSPSSTADADSDNLSHESPPNKRCKRKPLTTNHSFLPSTSLSTANARMPSSKHTANPPATSSHESSLSFSSTVVTTTTLVPSPSYPSSDSPTHSSTSPRRHPFTPSDLSALLSSSFPSHDFTSSALALHSAGLSTLDTLSTLLLIDQDDAVEAFVETVAEKAAFREVETSFVQTALKKLRDDYRAGH
jgi:hypothetical protein